MSAIFHFAKAMRRLGNMSGGAVLREGAGDGIIFCVSLGGNGAGHRAV